MACEDLKKQRQSLPIYSARNSLIREFRQNNCCVVVGETGSGKTTQIPQYLLEAGFTKKGGVVGVTQPRRVAATSLAQRVALERGAELGEEVGYSVRFDDCSSSRTKLKFMTDGMLLREAILDPMLMKYNVVILDEAHERTVHTDLLFGVVKSAQRARAGRQLRRLKIIVMSATLACEKFSAYFCNARILYVQGRQHPVVLHYTFSPQRDYVSAAITTVMQLHEEEVEESGGSKGDILVFLTGREEIETVQDTLLRCCQLFPSDWLDLLVCPLFAALPSSQQNRVFQATPPGSRKVILSTNIAETSITIPGVRYVVDTGVAKVRGFNPRVRLDMLMVQPISKAQARQRTGRAGREAAGHCYRLYTQEHFDELADDTVPEILRCSLSSVILQLLAMGVANILTFDFMSPPPRDSLVRAVEQLYRLEAVEKLEEKESDECTQEKDRTGEGFNGEKIGKKSKKGKKVKTSQGMAEDVEEDEEDYNLQLTPLGQRLAHFPLEPALARAVLASHDLGCNQEVLAVVGMLSVDSVVYVPRDKKEAVAAAHLKFVSDDGDHMTLLNIYRAYKSNKGNKAWCKENFIHVRHMKIVLDVRQQLGELCERLGIPPASGGRECSGSVRMALLGGLFVNVAEHVGGGKYRTLSTRQEVHVHPSSCLFSVKPHPPCLMYSELVFTSKCYMRNVSVVEPDWLREVAPSLHSRMSSGR